MLSGTPCSGLQLRREKACKVWVQCLSSAEFALFWMPIMSKGKVRAYTVFDVRQKSGTPACCGGGRRTPPLRCRDLLFVSGRTCHTARFSARRAAGGGDETVQRRTQRCLLGPGCSEGWCAALSDLHLRHSGGQLSAGRGRSCSCWHTDAGPDYGPAIRAALCQGQSNTATARPLFSLCPGAVRCPGSRTATLSPLLTRQPRSGCV